jgi:hypothetical protein
LKIKTRRLAISINKFVVKSPVPVKTGIFCAGSVKQKSHPYALHGTGGPRLIIQFLTIKIITKMGKMIDAKKRDFVAQVTAFLEQNAQLLVGKGYDPAAKITQLRSEIVVTDEKEALQREAAAKAKDATKMANEAMNTAYTDASATVELLAGLLGKDNNLVIELRKLRNTDRPRKTTPVVEP